MEIAKIDVTGVRARAIVLSPIPVGMVGGTVRLVYGDPLWDGLNKTVVFSCGGVTKDILNAGELVTIPPEITAQLHKIVIVGVYGTDSRNNLVIPTLWATIGVVKEAASPSGDSSTEESLPVWAQLLGMIGDLNDMDTELSNGVNQLKGDIAAEVKRAKEAEDNRIRKFYTGNLGAVSVADSDDGAVRNLVIAGKSEQICTSGKNIIEFTPYVTNKSGNTIKYFPVPKIQKGKTYTISLIVDGNVSLTYKNSFVFLKGQTQLINKSHGRTFISEYDYSEIDKFYIYTTEDLAGINVIGAQIEEGEQITDYEPYTGGMPSPSPDYPQEIKSVENCSMTVSNADGTETQTASIPVTLHGIGDVQDELYVYADGTGKLVRRYPETLDPTMTVAEQALDTPMEMTLTSEQVKALYDLRTCYGGTNVSFESDNGVEPVVNFDYSCALEGFVEYIKAVRGDDRKMIYDMDDRITDAEYVAAMAYVNSEYASALAELMEV